MKALSAIVSHCIDFTAFTEINRQRGSQARKILYYNIAKNIDACILLAANLQLCFNLQDLISEIIFLLIYKQMWKAQIKYKWEQEKKGTSRLRELPQDKKYWKFNFSAFEFLTQRNHREKFSRFLMRLSDKKN